MSTETTPAPRSCVEGLLEEGRRLQALAEKAEAWKPPSGCCEAGFKLSPRGFCSECGAGPDETCRMRWGAPPAMFEAAMVKDGMSLIRSLCEALGEAQDKIAQLRLISNVNGDWSMKCANLQDRAEQAESSLARLQAECDTVKATLDACQKNKEMLRKERDDAERQRAEALKQNVALSAECDRMREVVIRVIHELRTYDPSADEYKGKHIHKVWARELDAAIARTAPAQEGNDGNS